MIDFSGFFKKLFNVYIYGPTWGQYLNLLPSLPFLSKKDERYQLITGTRRICAYQAQCSGLGIRYNSDRHMVVSELVTPAHTTASFAVERVISKADNSVIFLPVFQNKVVLVESYRYPLHGSTLEFFKSIDSLTSFIPQDLVNYFCSMTGIPYESVDTPQLLGHVLADPVYDHQSIAVYLVPLISMNFHFTHFELSVTEKTARARYDWDFIRADAFDKDEIRQLILDGRLRDAQTLAAFMLYLSKQ